MILLENVGKFYYSETSVTQALRKVNLSFHVGEFVAITGESGSGKSTLLNIISGMDTFDEGELFFNGEPTFQYDASDWEDFRRKQIGFVFQDYNLIGHYSALDNVTSALLIMGADKDTASVQAMTYLEKVGLKGMENQRASELSSGQKQRLSIARALAKETKIIVADEPTGNLDSETGEQIISLLKELSKDRLILMVTHNYEQAAPYVTRKIRLHDGEVVVDVQVNNTMDSTKSPDTTATEIKQDEASDTKIDTSNNNKLWKKQQRNVARSFARMNIRTQKGRSLLFGTFFLFTAVISFVLIGQLYKCADDTYTKDYDKTIFYQKNDSRLSVIRKDGKELTDKDIQKLQSVRNVVQVDSQGYAGDINYYMEEGKDYVYHHETTEEQTEWEEWDWNPSIKSSLASENIPDFKKKNKFMRSSTCIDSSDLSQGRLPKNRNEIVLYPTKNSKLGDTTKIYFTAENIWGDDQYYEGNLKVVGLLKKETAQVYFYPDFCRMLSATADGDEITLNYSYSAKYGNYLGLDHFILTIGEDLQEQEQREGAGIPYARVSRNHIPTAEIFDDSGNIVHSPVENVLPGTDQIFIKINKSKDNIPKQLSEIDETKSEICVLGMDSQGDEEKTNQNFNNHSGMFMEVSEDTFNKYYPRQSSQASVYIKNYAKTDQVLNALDKLGYEGISTYRIASVNYNSGKVMDRLIFICIAVGILIVLFAVEVLILRSIMKLRINDFFVMKSMGMQLPVIRQISFYEMTRYCIEAIIFAAAIMIILNIIGIPYITSMMIYYGVLASITYILYNIVLELTTVWAFNRLLTGKMTK